MIDDIAILKLVHIYNMFGCLGINPPFFIITSYWLQKPQLWDAYHEPCQLDLLHPWFLPKFSHYSLRRSSRIHSQNVMVYHKTKHACFEALVLACLFQLQSKFIFFIVKIVLNIKCLYFPFVSSSSLSSILKLSSTLR